MKKRSKNLTEGNIKKQLYTLTWPMLFGMMGMVIFNLADTYFVGRLGVNQLAAMSFSFPVVMFVNSLSHGIGIGTSSLVSRNIITESRENVKLMASRSILLGVLMVAIFVTIGLNTMRPVFSSLGADDNILDYVMDYMGIWYFGVPFVVIPMIGNNIVRATGDTFLPGMLMVTSAIANIILDPILIFGLGPVPAMGIKGAALATVIGRSIGLVFILFVLIRRENLITLKFGKIKAILGTWRNVLYIAGPAAIGMLITPLSIGFVTKIIAGFGKEAVAAFGVATRVEMFALMVIVSLGSVLIIFIGQNISKNKFARIFKTLNYSLVFSMSWGILVFALFLLLGKPIASVFTDDPTVIDVARKYFYIVGSSYGFQGLLLLSTSSFNGLNKPYPSAIFSVVRMVVLYAPLAWLGARIVGITGVFWAGFTANVIVGILSFGYLQKMVHKMKLATELI